MSDKTDRVNCSDCKDHKSKNEDPSCVSCMQITHGWINFEKR